MTFTYIAARHGSTLLKGVETLDEALERAYWDNELGEAYPVEIIDNDTEIAILSNRGGHPSREGSCPLLDRLHEFGREHYPEDYED